MNEEILKKLERRIGRRSFLRGSGLAAAALVGAATLPATSFAQDQQGRNERQDKPDNGQDGGGSGGNKDKKDDDKQDSGSDDPYKVIRIDSNGREYRMCPVCGSNMYREDHTWTCENCGYSYEE